MGVTVDDDYVPDLPSKLFQEGRFDDTISVLTGHNLDEGSRFIPSTLVTNDTTYSAFLASLITPLAGNATALQYITQELYPPVFDGSQGYTTQTERNNLTIADATIVCNARFMDEAAFRAPTYAYLYSAPPPVHGADLSYTFYDFGNVTGVNSTLAEIMQSYLTRFAETGNPNAPGLPTFRPARPGLTVQNLGVDFVGPVPDEGGITRIEERCRFWRDAAYLTRYRSDAKMLI